MCKYTIFQSDWGYLGFSAEHGRITKVILPLDSEKNVENLLKTFSPTAKFDPNLLPTAQKLIKDYFAGHFSPDIHDIPVKTDHLTPFSAKVYNQLRKTRPGQTLTYAQLAALAGSPNASRAVGSAMRKNQIPLIIPCHRVIKTDGTTGHFSASGGQAMKQKLLRHENVCFR